MMPLSVWTPPAAAALLLLVAIANGFSLRDNRESNEVHNRNKELSHAPSLPLCRSNSVCAYLQANSRGINVEHMCDCPGPRSCSLVWDSMDGHSVSQGSDQYKFCERVPEKSHCNPLVIAYTAKIEYSKQSGEKELLSNHVHCHCPDRFGYEVLDTQFGETDELEIMETTYTCQPLKTCAASDSCRVVTETSSSYLVKTVCTCPHGLTCPSNTRFAVESTTMEKGTVSLIRCQ